MDGANGFAIVALVASSGGLDALSRVLGPLREDLPAAVIVLQHMDPSRHSQLAEILDARCQLPVHEAAHGEKLSPGTVVVAPAGKHLFHTNDGSLALVVSGAFPPHRPSADLLLTSLALTAGHRAIAVVLSGLGNDGATGATAVHDFGGVVVAADEASSKEYSMPAATVGRGDALDFELHVDEIAELLRALVTGGHRSRTNA